MQIIHGENTTASRDKLIDIITKLKQQQFEIIRLDAKDISEADLEAALGSSDLFGTKKAVIIEGLHSLPKSQKLKNLLELCANQTPKQSQNHELILWEKRELTATMLKNFNDAQVFVFKASKTLFAWLDLLGKPGSEEKKLQLLHAAVASDGEYFCFLMLARQIRLLIQAKSGEKIAGAPFVVTKLQKQAQNFTLEQLVKLHAQLLEFDLLQKTSSNVLNMNQWLDLFSLKL